MLLFYVKFAGIIILLLVAQVVMCLFMKTKLFKFILPVMYCAFTIFFMMLFNNYANNTSNISPLVMIAKNARYLFGINVPTMIMVLLGIFLKKKNDGDE